MVEANPDEAPFFLEAVPAVLVPLDVLFAAAVAEDEEEAAEEEAGFVAAAIAAVAARRCCWRSCFSCCFFCLVVSLARVLCWMRRFPVSSCPSKPNPSPV